MPFTGHEELKNFVGRGLSGWNYLGAITGDYTLWASATDVASWQAVNNAEEAKAKYHETDKPIFRINNRDVDTLNQMSIFTNTDIAATNDQSTGDARFTAQDASFPATYIGGRGF